MLFIPTPLTNSIVVKIFINKLPGMSVGGGGWVGEGGQVL